MAGDIVAGVVVAGVIVPGISMAGVIVASVIVDHETAMGLLGEAMGPIAPHGAPIHLGPWGHMQFP